MDCRGLMETLSACLDGEASPEEARLVEEHLEACGECRSAADRMRRLGVATASIEEEVPAGFRERLFVRLEREELLPRRRNIFVYAVRWALLPAAAALALFLLVPRDVDRVATGPREEPARVAQGSPRESPAVRPPGVPGPSAVRRPGADVSPRSEEKDGRRESIAADPAGSTIGAEHPAKAEDLPPEDRNIVAYLEILEEPDLVGNGDADAVDVLLPPGKDRG
jgi:hypothetical protein